MTDPPISDYALSFRSDVAVVRLIDALAVGPTDRGHGLGAGAPHALLRTVEIQAQRAAHRT